MPAPDSARRRARASNHILNALVLAYPSILCSPAHSWKFDKCHSNLQVKMEGRQLVCSGGEVATALVSPDVSKEKTSYFEVQIETSNAECSIKIGFYISDKARDSTPGKQAEGRILGRGGCGVGRVSVGRDEKGTKGRKNKMASAGISLSVARRISLN